MKKNLKWLLPVLALTVLIIGASVLYEKLGEDYQMSNLATEPPTGAVEEIAPEKPAEEATEVSDYLAPDFTVTDLEGNPVNLSDFFGKPIVLNFWASWCGPCRSEMPEFNEAYLAQGENIHFLMVNMTDGGQETVDTASAFIADAGYSFPVYYDTGYDAAITYGVSSLPTTYFIDASGSLVTYAMGAIDAETLALGISMITE